MTQPTPRCSAHNTETLLRCGKCDQPICPRCTVMGPAGARCKACSSHSSMAMYQVTVAAVVAGFASAYIVATVGGILLSWVLETGIFGLFWLGVLLGFAVGETVMRVAGHKRGRWMEIAAGSAAVFGIAMGLWIGCQLQPDLDSSAMLEHLPALLTGIAAAATIAVVRVRF